MAFASIGKDIESPPGSGPYSFRIHGQIYHLVLPMRQNQRNNVGYRLHIFDCAEAARKRLETQLNRGCMAEEMQLLDEMLRSHINECVK
jgi:hypothetical protein